ncbi:MAG: tetratricopeptide repeat protein [Woeseiaceae bacterium]|nr:tetratricopeptide repeat protein [Woeseiaceae bacterium]
MQAEMDQVTSLLRDGSSDAARARCDSLIWRFPKSMDIRLLASSVEQQSGDFDRMLERAEEALAMAPAHTGAQFRVLECRLYCGQADRVVATLAEMEASAGNDHALIARIAEFYTHCTRHADALRCLRRATELQPVNPAYQFSLAAALIATGELEEAEQTLDHVIALDPHDYDAYRNRSTLRTQGPDDNHIDEMLALLQRGVRTAGR